MIVMITTTFAISKGGVGKSLVTANVGAALAKRGSQVVLVEGDPNHPLQLILGVYIDPKDTELDDVIKKDSAIENVIHPTSINNLSILPSGISLQKYFDIDLVRFVKKIVNAKADFLFIDVPFPLGNAAFLSLGMCDYFIPILTEDEFPLCIESALDTIRVGKYYLRCLPLGFILNRIKSRDRFTGTSVRDLEELLDLPCITLIREDNQVSKSYGGASSEEAFLAYDVLQKTEFSRSIDKIADLLLGKLPEPRKKDPAKFLTEIMKVG